MKKLGLLITVVGAFLLLTTNVMAQGSGATASATGTATIVAPIAIANTGDMNFGNVAVDAGTGGTVVLDPAGARTETGGVTLPATAGTVTAAAFNVTGEGAYTYAITLPPGDYTITKPVTFETMAVNTFTSTPSVTGALTAGAQALTVGATLNVSAAQVAGEYTNAVGFDVIVNYN